MKFPFKNAFPIQFDFITVNVKNYTLNNYHRFKTFSRREDNILQNLLT